jgi:hypothetical protein
MTVRKPIGDRSRIHRFDHSVVGPEMTTPPGSQGHGIRGTCFNGFVPTSATSASYLICATPRSGSTFLCELLQSTGIAGRPESYFRLPDESTWVDRWQIARDPDESSDYRDYVQAAVKDGSTENGLFGARVMWGTMDEVVANLSTCAEISLAPISSC